MATTTTATTTTATTATTATTTTTRRGSISAPDPYGKHPRLESSSTLTIVRVSNSQDSSSKRHQRPRLSFAASSFSPTISPPSSPRLRPTTIKSRLTPDQLVDLARSTTSPSHSPLLIASLNSPTTPATFTLLPHYIYLPFIDRPSEVASLISSPPSAKLFSLLAQIFQNHSTSFSSSPSPPDDPTNWSYQQLHHHLTTITRSQMPDTLWVALARKCVLFHSELIWERIKGALGVPPELDIDYNLHSDILSSSASSIDTDDISDDHGRSARGHWDDWDAVMDSPVFDRRHSSASTSSPPNFHTRPTAEHPTSLLETRLSSSPPKSTWDSDSPASSFLSIEPILVPTCPSTLLSPTAPPPFSLSTSETTGVMGLGDIQESAEDDAETEISSPNENDPTKDTPNEGDPDLISPTQIQGLRISTTPLNPASTESPNLLLNLSPIGSIAPPNSSSSLSSYVAPPPVSPLPPYPSTGTATARPSSRSSSISSIGAGSFRRSGSWGSLSAALGSSLAGLPRNDEGGYNPVGDRAPGNPLFPSNFASLAVGPTLVANNPTLRSPPLPPQSRYSTNLSAGLYRSVHGHGQKQRTYSHSAAVGSSPGRGTGNTDVSRRQSWGHGSRGGGGNDYAVSVTSVESAGE